MTYIIAERTVVDQLTDTASKELEQFLEQRCFLEMDQLPNIAFHVRLVVVRVGFMLFRSTSPQLHTPDSGQHLKLMEAMTTSLESHRRDELDPSRSKQLHRFKQDFLFVS